MTSSRNQQGDSQRLTGPSIHIAPQVADALRERKPVVALETAVLTHGLPRTSLGIEPPSNITDWQSTAPVNLETVRAMQRAITSAGATPAAIGVIDGTLHIGLDDELLARLARDEIANKASISKLASIMARGASAGITVSATLAACRLAEPEPIRVFATGGIGGVHPGWTDRPDISADLRELARAPVCVVCAGAKSLLDLPATLEALETLGVPVIGYRTSVLPRFHSPGTGNPGDPEGLRLMQRADEPRAIAAICGAQWQTLHRDAAVLIANPVPESAALDDDELDRAIVEASRIAEKRNIIGPERTPFMLAELARVTHGKSLIANIALLVNNAQLAAEIAKSFSSA